MIKKIKLANFKCFKDEEFDIAPLTLFAGINGMGKSSVVQSLLLLKQSYELGILQKNKVDLDNDFINLETAQDLCYEKADEKKVGIHLETFSEASYSWIINASNPKEKILECHTSENKEYASLPLFSKDFIYLSAERWGPREDYNRKEKRVYNTRLGIQGELTPPFLFNSISEDQQLVINDMKHRSTSTNSLYENLNAWQGDILGQKIKTKISEIDQERVKLSYNIEGLKGGDFSALQVGFGFTYSLPAIVAPLIAKPNDLIIIENPESHLHPGAQSRLGRLLARAVKNGVQVIIETHSDHVLNAIRVATKKDGLDHKKTQIHFFTNETLESEQKNYKIPFKIGENGELPRWPEGFFDEWDKNLDELID